MDSPLKFDTKTIEKYKITEDIDVSLDYKIAYVTTQIEEMKKALYRNRLDLIITQNLINGDDEALEGKGRENEAQYKLFIKQTVGAIKTQLQLLKELKAKK